MIRYSAEQPEIASTDKRRLKRSRTLPVIPARKPGYILPGKPPADCARNWMMTYRCSPDETMNRIHCWSTSPLRIVYGQDWI